MSVVETRVGLICVLWVRLRYRAFCAIPSLSLIPFILPAQPQQGLYSLLCYLDCVSMEPVKRAQFSGSSARAKALFAFQSVLSHATKP